MQLTPFITSWFFLIDAYTYVWLYFRHRNGHPRGKLVRDERGEQEASSYKQKRNINDEDENALITNTGPNIFESRYERAVSACAK